MWKPISVVPPPPHTHTFISHWLSFSLIFFSEIYLLRVGRHSCLELAGRQKEYGCTQLSECHFHTYKRWHNEQPQVFVCVRARAHVCVSVWKAGRWGRGCSIPTGGQRKSKGTKKTHPYLAGGFCLPWQLSVWGKEGDPGGGGGEEEGPQ